MPVSSILGGALIIGGLYVVTWASYRETQAVIGILPHVARSSESPVHNNGPINKLSDQRGLVFSGSSTLLRKALD